VNNTIRENNSALMGFSMSIMYHWIGMVFEQSVVIPYAYKTNSITIT